MTVMYPVVLSETQTLDLLHKGKSIARFGDGELRVALGGGCKGQGANDKLALELRKILKNNFEDLVVGIPNIFSKTPKYSNWKSYTGDKYVSLYDHNMAYGSAFISRPDSAPWIDTYDYWESVRDLWRKKSVILVSGSEKSLTEGMLDAQADHVLHIPAPAENAYSEINKIMQSIPNDGRLVLICLGVAGTVLAARLCARGQQALDLGHIGMFMKHEGVFSFDAKSLASQDYRKKLTEIHSSETWGHDGAKHTDAVFDYASRIDARSVLDYGCGGGRLKIDLERKGFKFFIGEYDIGIPSKSMLPKPADLVVCTDVLEHVERNKLPAVLRHLKLLMAKGAYFVIATRPARKILDDGRNAHLIVERGEWWLDELRTAGFKIDEFQIQEGKEVRVWMKK